jgi:hypothetical protein
MYKLHIIIITSLFCEYINRTISACVTMQRYLSHNNLQFLSNLNSIAFIFVCCRVNISRRCPPHNALMPACLGQGCDLDSGPVCGIDDTGMPRTFENRCMADLAYCQYGTCKQILLKTLLIAAILIFCRFCRSQTWRMLITSGTS